MIAESSSVGVFTTDAQLTIRTWDAWLAHASGVAEADVLGKPLLEVFPEIIERGLQSRLESVLRDGVVEVLAPAFHHYLIRIPTTQGASFFDAMQQHVTISPLRYQAGVSGIVITIEDVTARFVRERQLVEQLKSHDEAVRLRAAKRLADPTHDPTPLLGALADTSWQVRRLAAAGIAEQGSDQIVQHLIQTIRDKHDNLALLNATLTALAQTRHDVLPSLLPLLKSPEANVRMYTALALGQLKDARATQPLLELLDDPDANVRYHVIEALGRIRARAANDPLLDIVRSRDPFLSFAALDAIALIGAPSSIDDVLALLDDELLAEAAIDASALLGTEKAVAPLLRALRNGAPAARVCYALSAIYHRLEHAYGEGALVAHLVRREIDTTDLERIVGALPRATDSELSAGAEVLGWLQQAGLESVLARLLAHPAARAAARDALVNRGSHALPALSEMLVHEDSEVRKAAALGIGQIGAADGVPVLVQLLSDTAPEVVIAAALALASIGSDAAFDPLVQLLAHSDAAVRSAVVSAINSIGHADTEKVVCKLVESSDSNIRESAVKIAGYFGFQGCFEQVLALAVNINEPVQRLAVEHLGYFNDTRVLPALDAAMRSSNAAVRTAAARAIGHAEGDAVAPYLERALADPDGRVRYHAIRSIVTHDLRSFVGELRNRLQSDTDIPVRIAAAQALYHFRDDRAAGNLALLVDDAESDLACAAIAALGAMPGTHAESALIMALSSGDPRRQIAALQAAEDTGMESLLPYVQRVLRQSNDRSVRAAALRLLTRNGGPAGIAAVLELAADPEWDAECIAALARIPNHQVTHLARGLKHTNPHVRWVVVESLARMKKSESSKILAEALTDRDPTVRFAISQALGRLDLF